MNTSNNYWTGVYNCYNYCTIKLINNISFNVIYILLLLNIIYILILYLIFTNEKKKKLFTTFKFVCNSYLEIGSYDDIVLLVTN